MAVGEGLELVSRELKAEGFRVRRPKHSEATLG